MNNIKYDEHIAIKPGDKIHLILYYDHADTEESIEELRKNPPLLWSIGKIINMHTNDIFYLVLSTGSVGRYLKPKVKDYILKSAIKSMKVIYTIPNNFEDQEGEKF